MRSLLYTLVTFLSITFVVCHIPFSAVAQNDITKDIYLKRSRDTRSKIFLGQSIKEAIPALGKPDKIEDYYFEADEKTGKLYHYGQSHVFFMDDKLDSFNIPDSSLIVGLHNGPEFHVGDDFRAAKFKNYKARYSPGMSFNTYATWMIGLNIASSDDTLFLLFDKNEKLNGIHHYSPI